MIKLFNNFTKKDKATIFIIVVLVTLSVFLDLRTPEYMSKITRLVQTENSAMKDILISGGYMLLCAILSLLCTVIVGYFSSLLSANFSKNVRRRLFMKVEKLGIAEIKKFSTSSLITRTTNDVTQIEMLIAMGLPLIIKSPIMAIWALIKILGKSNELSAVTGVCVIVIVITNVFIIKSVTPRFKKLQKLTDKLNGVTRENLTGIRVIHAFNAEEFQENRFEEVNIDVTDIQLKNQKTFAIMGPVMNIVMHFQGLGIYIVGAFIIINLSMMDKINMFSNMIVFSSYGMQVIMSFLMLTMIFMIMPRAGVSAARINEVLESDISITDGDYEGEFTEKGVVEFKNVSFKYPDADEYLLKNINFKVNKGETIAFIGSTGSGKSTLINLIPRLYDATEGEVLVDGVNVKKYKLYNLNNKIAYIPQKAVMFTGTVKDNIVYGDNGIERTSMDEVKIAIEVAQAKDFIEKMDDK